MTKHEQVLRELRTDLTRRIVDYAKAGTTHLAPEVMDVDISFFMDRELFDREYQKLFRETPLVACLSTDLPEPGTFHAYDDLDIPIVVIRGKGKGPGSRISQYLPASRRASCPHQIRQSQPLHLPLQWLDV